MSDETYKYRIIVHRLRADGHPTSYFHGFCFGSDVYSFSKSDRADKQAAEILMADAMLWQTNGIGHDIMTEKYGPIIKLDLVEDTPEKASYVIWTRRIYPLLEEVTDGHHD